MTELGGLLRSKIRDTACILKLPGLGQTYATVVPHLRKRKASWNLEIATLPHSIGGVCQLFGALADKATSAIRDLCSLYAASRRPEANAGHKISPM